MKKNEPIPAQKQQLVLDVKYVVNHSSEVLKQAVYGGIRVKTSDSTIVMAVHEPVNNKTINIDLSDIEWVKVKGRTRRLRSAPSKWQLREAELKFLLEGKKLEEWTKPFLRSYDRDDLIGPRKPLYAKLIDGLIAGIGFLFLSLPGLAVIGIAGFMVYMVMTMMHGAQHAHMK